jgi:hypothetical protein
MTVPNEVGPTEGRDLTTEELAEGADARWAQGPVEILRPPDDDAPALPPEVWQHPPAGLKLPE